MLAFIILIISRRSDHSGIIRTQNDLGTAEFETMLFAGCFQGLTQSLIGRHAPGYGYPFHMVIHRSLHGFRYQHLDHGPLHIEIDGSIILELAKRLTAEPGAHFDIGPGGEPID